MRLAELERRLGDRITVERRSFLLRAEPKTGDRERFIEYTKSWLRPAAEEPAANFQVWASEAEQPSSSIPAQVAWQLVRRVWPDKAEQFHDLLMDAYFRQNRNIADDAELTLLAEEVGIEPAEFSSALDEQRAELTALVIADHNAAIQAGVTGVPTVVFNHQFPIPGAQPVETLERIVSKIESKAV